MKCTKVVCNIGGINFAIVVTSCFCLFFWGGVGLFLNILANKHTVCDNVMVWFISEENNVDFPWTGSPVTSE